MKAVDDHLYIRNRYFYYRCALPRNLHSPLPFKEIVIALGTQDFTLARLYVAKLDFETQNIISQTYTALRHATSINDVERSQALLMQGIE